MAKPSPHWWVTFRIIEEGSLVSILQLLDSGAFTEQRISTIREAIAGEGSS